MLNAGHLAVTMIPIRTGTTSGVKRIPKRKKGSMSHPTTIQMLGDPLHHLVRSNQLLSRRHLHVVARPVQRPPHKVEFVAREERDRKLEHEDGTQAVSAQYQFPTMIG